MFRKTARLVLTLAIIPWTASLNPVVFQAPTLYILTVAGGGGVGDGPALEAGINFPFDINHDTAGNIYIADNLNHRIRVLNRQTVDITVAGAVIPPSHVQTVAGTGNAGFSGDGGQSRQANLNQPFSIAVDAAGNIYMTDLNFRVRRIDTTGVISTIAGNGVNASTGDGGPAISASVRRGLIRFMSSGLLMINDANNLRAINPTNGNITILGTTIAPGNIQTIFTGSFGDTLLSALDGTDNIYGRRTFGDGTNDLRVINTQSTSITVLGVTIPPGQRAKVAGGGTSTADGATAQNTVMSTFALDVDTSGSIIYGDLAPTIIIPPPRIRRIDSSTTLVTTVAGTGQSGFAGDGGPALNARLMSPTALIFDAVRNSVIFSDRDTNRVREFFVGGNINTIAGSGYGGFSGDDALSYTASLSRPFDVKVDSGGNMFVADSGNSRIFRVDINGNLTTLAGNGAPLSTGDGGPASAATLFTPFSLALDSNGNIYVGEAARPKIRVINRQPTNITIAGVTIAPGNIDTIAGTGVSGFNIEGGPARTVQIGIAPRIVVDSQGNIFVSDSLGHRIRAINPSSTETRVFANVSVGTGEMRTIAGQGAGFGGNGGFAGDNGPALSATLALPSFITLDASENILFCESFTHTVRRIDRTTGVISIHAGTPLLSNFGTFTGDGGPATSATFNGPQGLAFDSAGNLYIADASNHRIRMVETSTGNIFTVAGNGSAVFSGDGGLATSASLNGPIGIAIDAQDRIYIADRANNRIRRLAPNNVAAGSGPITVSPIPGITFTFNGTVTNGGFLAVTTDQTGPALPDDFALGNINRRIFYFAEPVAGLSFTGTVTVCINYDNEYTGGQETSLKLLQKTATGASFNDITSPGFPDQTNNLICGQTSSFSVFKVAQELFFPVAVIIEPEVINLKSKGVYTAFISSIFFSPGDVNPATFLANGVQPVHARAANNKFFVAQFERTSIQDLGNGTGFVKIEGRLNNGKLFIGTVTVPLK